MINKLSLKNDGIILLFFVSFINKRNIIKCQIKNWEKKKNQLRCRESNPGLDGESVKCYRLHHSGC